LNAGELEVVTIAALSSEYAEELVEKANVVDGYGKLDMSTVARAAVQGIETTCCATR